MRMSQNASRACSVTHPSTRILYCRVMIASLPSFRSQLSRWGRRWSLPGEHRGGFPLQVEIGITGDVDPHSAHRAASEPVIPVPRIVRGDGLAAVAADGQALAGDGEHAWLGTDLPLAHLPVAVV